MIALVLGTLLALAALGAVWFVVTYALYIVVMTLDEYRNETGSRIGSAIATTTILPLILVGWPLDVGFNWTYGLALGRFRASCSTFAGPPPAAGASRWPTSSASASSTPSRKMAIARRKIGPPPPKTAVEEYADELEFERELGALFDDGELPAAAASLRHQVIETPEAE
jgi:hypothetical protein